MTWIIGQIALRTGLGSLVASLIVYVAIAVFAVGALLGYGHHKYSEGRAIGASTERAAWVSQREEDRAKQLAKAAADQRKIDAIEADNQALQGQIAETQNALEDAIRAQPSNPPAIPRSVARAINGVGR